MLARLLATACLLSVSVPVGHAAPHQGVDAPVGVFLKTEVESTHLPLAQVQAELSELLAPAGVALEWMTSTQLRAANVATLISVELRGSCDFRKKPSGEFANRTALASTAVVDGRVLPFVWVDCTAVHQFLRSALNKASAAERERMAARAVARVLAHELYHVLAETEEHTESGIAKESFTVLDLVADRMAFERVAIARMMPPPALPMVASADEWFPTWVATLGEVLVDDEEDDTVALGR